MKRITTIITPVGIALALVLAMMTGAKASASYVLYNVEAPGYCLAAEYANAPGDPVFIYSDAGGACHTWNWLQWTTTPAGGGWLFVTNTYSSLCLYNPGGGRQLTVQLCDPTSLGDLWAQLPDGHGNWLFVDANAGGDPNHDTAADDRGISGSYNPVIGWAKNWQPYELWQAVAA